jgi:hypothetical protein
LNTGQPLAHVHVRRVLSESNAPPASTPSGGRLMQEDAASVRTDRDGQFVMKSSRVLGPLGATGWYGVTLAFEKAGYQSVVREYTLGNSTNTPAGEPVVAAGEILLLRVDE